MSFSARLDRLPLSRPHYLLLLMGGLGYTFDGLDGAVVAFLMPELKTLWDLSDAQLGLIGSATPMGFLVGALSAGLLGDRIGRKRVMMGALAFYAAFTVVAALSSNFEVFLGARILAGIGTGAESAIVAPFLAEFVPAAKRGWFVGTLAAFFSFGFVAAALLGRLVVPMDDGWRWAQLITATPVVMLLWWRRALPESPRYLASKGRDREAEEVVAKLEDAVRSAIKGPLPPVDRLAPLDQREPAGFTALASVRWLWSRSMWRATAVTWVIWFVVTFAYYGFFSWIPTLLIRQGITVTRSFEFTIIIYLANLPGYLSAAWLTERLDRKNTIAIYLAGSAVAAFWLSQMSEPVAITAAGATLAFFLNGTYSALYAYTPEVFPTHVRATGTGLASAFGRVGSISAPIIIGATAASWGFVGVFGLTTTVLLIGIVVTIAFAVPTRGRSLEEVSGGALDQAASNGSTRPDAHNSNDRMPHE